MESLQPPVTLSCLNSGRIPLSIYMLSQHTVRINDFSVVFLLETTLVSSRTERIRQTHASVRALTTEKPRMVKVDPDLQRIAGKPAYLAFLSDIKGWGIFICVWTQSVPT